MKRLFALILTTAMVGGLLTIPAAAYSTDQDPSAPVSTRPASPERGADPADFSSFLSQLFRSGKNAAAAVNALLDPRCEKQPDPCDKDLFKIPVTKDLLIRFIEDRIQTYRTVSQLPLDVPNLDQDAAILTPEEGRQEALAMLDKLTPFLEKVKASVSDQNAFAFWCEYWDTILKEPRPTLYIPTSSGTLNLVEKVLGSAKTNQIMEQAQIKETSASRVLLETLPTDLLSDIFNALSEAPADSIDKDLQKGDAVAAVGQILDTRYEVSITLYGDDVIPKTPVTKDLLIRFIEDRIQTYRTVSQLPLNVPNLDQDAAILTPEEGRQQALAMLNKLTPFLEKVKASASDQNAFDLWCEYWDTILKEPRPALYIPAK